MSWVIAARFALPPAKAALCWTRTSEMGPRKPETRQPTIARPTTTRAMIRTASSRPPQGPADPRRPSLTMGLSSDTHIANIFDAGRRRVKLEEQCDGDPTDAGRAVRRPRRLALRAALRHRGRRRRDAAAPALCGRGAARRGGRAADARRAVLGLSLPQDHRRSGGQGTPGDRARPDRLWPLRQAGAARRLHL